MKLPLPLVLSTLMLGLATSACKSLNNDLGRNVYERELEDSFSDEPAGVVGTTADTRLVIFRENSFVAEARPEGEMLSAKGTDKTAVNVAPESSQGLRFFREASFRLAEARANSIEGMLALKEAGMDDRTIAVMFPGREDWTTMYMNTLDMSREAIMAEFKAGAQADQLELKLEMNRIEAELEAEVARRQTDLGFREAELEAEVDMRELELGGSSWGGENFTWAVDGNWDARDGDEYEGEECDSFEEYIDFSDNDCQLFDAREGDGDCEAFDACEGDSGCDVLDACEGDSCCEVFDACEGDAGCDVLDACEVGSGCEALDACEVGSGCEVLDACEVGSGCEVLDACEGDSCCEVLDACEGDAGCEVLDACEGDAGCEVFDCEEVEGYRESCGLATMVPVVFEECASTDSDCEAAPSCPIENNVFEFEEVNCAPPTCEEELECEEGSSTFCDTEMSASLELEAYAVTTTLSGLTTVSMAGATDVIALSDIRFEQPAGSLEGTKATPRAGKSWKIKYSSPERAGETVELVIYNLDSAKGKNASPELTATFAVTLNKKGKANLKADVPADWRLVRLEAPGAKPLFAVFL